MDKELVKLQRVIERIVVELRLLDSQVLGLRQSVYKALRRANAEQNDVRCTGRNEELLQDS